VAGIVGKAIVDGLINGAKALPGLLAAAVATGVQVVSGIAGYAFDLAISVGSAIVDGMVSGVRGAAGRLASAAIDAASGALNAAKDFIGFGSPAKAFIPLGESMVTGMAKGITLKKTALQSSLAAAIRDAVQSGRQTVTSLAGTLGDIIGNVMDKRKVADPAESVKAPQTAAEKAVADAQAGIEALDRAARKEELEKAIADVEATEDEKNKARLELVVLGNEEQAALDAIARDTKFDLDEKARQTAIDNAQKERDEKKALLQQHIADLTDAYNRKTKEEDGSVITTKEYMERMQALLHDAVPDFGEIGASLGSAVANQFADAMAAVGAQIDALKGEAGQVGTAITDPKLVKQAGKDLAKTNRQIAERNHALDVAQARLAKEKKEAADAKGPGGKDMTAAEKEQIRLAQAAVTKANNQVNELERIADYLQAIINSGGEQTVTLVR
jgi:hypothetical protein